MTDASERVRRVDAERNREAILAAARSAFAEPDAHVSMAEVARRAGVGQATLYRNFPHRRALLEALYAGEIDAVCDAAQTVEGETAGDRLVAWLWRFYAYYTSKRSVARDLLDVDPEARTRVFPGGRTRVLAAGEPLLAAAREASEVRDDLSLDQIVELVAAVASITRSTDERETILTVALDGLRAQR